MSATQDRLNAYIACENNILAGGQSVRAPDGRLVTMPDLEQIRAEIKSLRLAVSRAANNGRVRHSLSRFHDAEDYRQQRYDYEYQW
ncbi:MAG: hypothetical protein PF501_09930 [Salinisphaera sp.]|jgi:hypothetical protein|nr:hypothetical protein [Salinisphaera sp.]